MIRRFPKDIIEAAKERGEYMAYLVIEGKHRNKQDDDPLKGGYAFEGPVSREMVKDLLEAVRRNENEEPKQ